MNTALIEACLKRIREEHEVRPEWFKSWVVEDAPWEFLELFEEHLELSAEAKDVAFEHCRCLGYAIRAFLHCSFADNLLTILRFAKYYLVSSLADSKLWIR